MTCDCRIDGHLHAVPPFAHEAMRFMADVTGDEPAGRVASVGWTPERAIEFMDRHGISAAVTFPPPVRLGGPGRGTAFARQCNEYSAEVVQQWPRRFGSYASVPLPDVESACAEAEYALAELGLDGVGLWTNYEQSYLGDALFDPLFELLNDHSAVVFVHPFRHPANEALRLPHPDFLVEFPFATTRAAVNLITSGVLERFPNVRFVLAHAGGTLPYLASRLAAGSSMASTLPGLTPDVVATALRSFWYDMAFAVGEPTVAALDALADPDHLIFGSDWPFAAEGVVDDMTQRLDSDGFLTAAQRRRINGDNACALFPRLSPDRPTIAGDRQGA